MDMGEPERKPLPESIVPMINVVFLLLVFFLMTATIAPPDPFEVALPESRSEEPSETDLALYLSADGQLSWDGVEGEAALLALAESGRGRDAGDPLIIRADRELPGVEIARLLARLAALGITASKLVAEAPA